MRIRWFPEAREKYYGTLLFYKTQVGKKYAELFRRRVAAAVRQLARFPESGVLRADTPMGQHGFRALFIDNYVCVYSVDRDTIFIHHFLDARSNYMDHIFGAETDDGIKQ